MPVKQQVGLWLVELEQVHVPCALPCCLHAFLCSYACRQGQRQRGQTLQSSRRCVNPEDSARVQPCRCLACHMRIHDALKVSVAVVGVKKGGCSPLTVLGSFRPQGEPAECPLCVEPLDETDLTFKPCPCGYALA